MKKRVVLGVAVLFATSVLSMGQAYQTPEDSGALDDFKWYIGHISQCVQILDHWTHGTGTSFRIPPGEYCLWYHTPNQPVVTYDFGYVNWDGDFSPATCGPLIRLVEGIHPSDCRFEQCHEASIYPPNPALPVVIHASPFGENAQLWINGEPETVSAVSSPSEGFYTSAEQLNWDQEPHAYCYGVELDVAEIVDCPCVCPGGDITGVFDPEHLIESKGGFLVFWETTCPFPAVPDWDDFWVILIPAKVGK